MHPRVAKLYLEFMLLAPALTSSGSVVHAAELGRALPSFTQSTKTTSRHAGSLSSTAGYRAMVQKGFADPPKVTPDTPEFKRRLARGRWALRQLQDILAVKKYRAMHKRYDWSSQRSLDELTEMFGEVRAQEMTMGLGNKDVFGYDESVDEERYHLPKEEGGNKLT